VNATKSTRKVTLEEEVFTLFLTREEAERIWFLSYASEGGNAFPDGPSGERIHTQLAIAFHDLPTTALARFRPEETL
jgi:hypothetical protein